ncbi:thiamine pyrophosphate-dependent dehydrogenase E1 component subunit alpha [Candidatus Pelagibacter sp.]|nr:thiamine pyrophosphate-dependent dehydrogenase E1 component subunit alpha [Candidatus Pelagibacter sp.]
MKLKDKLKIYYHLLLIRSVEEAIVERYHPADKMRCPIHMCVGQELAPSVLNLFLKPEDGLWSHHRSHGYFMSKGGSVKEMIAEFYGKKTGTNGGLAGSQELSDPRINFFSGTILCGAFAMGVGDAFAKKYKNQKNISVAIVGDGGMEEGIVFESMNIAAMMNLPIVFICENNLYSVHTKLKERQTSNSIYQKAKTFGIKSSIYKGNDPDKLYEIFNNINSYVRKKSKPYFIELSTYRFSGHVGPEGDDHYNYRPKKEIEYWKKRDPLKFYEKKLEKNIKNFEQTNREYKSKINKIISEAFDFAEKSKFPNEYLKYNFQGTYDKVVKKFYDNDIKLAEIQKDHQPKPY